MWSKGESKMGATMETRVRVGTGRGRGQVEAEGMSWFLSAGMQRGGEGGERCAMHLTASSAEGMLERA